MSRRFRIGPFSLDRLNTCRGCAGIALWLAIPLGGCLVPLASTRAEQAAAPVTSPDQAAPHKPPRRRTKAETPTAEPQVPAAPKPAAEAAPATGQPEKAPKSAATPVESTPAHALEGIWKIYWYSENKTTELRVAQVSARPGITDFLGALVIIDGQACPMTGNVVDNLAGSFTDGLETPNVAISAFVVIHALCPQGQAWVEALGLPAGKVLMNGRLTMIAVNGTRTHFSIGLGR